MAWGNGTVISEEKLVFQVFFLKNNNNLSVEVVEVEQIDFGEVERRLEGQESVFIVRKRKQKFNTILVAKEDAAEPWYFTRM